jgi:23S rRNA (uracil1939-C5)-methyltransferase
MRTTGTMVLETTIGSMAPGGDGVGHADVDGERRAVFVPRTAPGDRARLEVDPSRRPARGRVLELLARGRDRVQPACAWAERCGGCDWMHLSLEAQARFHLEHLRAALPARWRDVATSWSPSSQGLAYRSRARLHVRCGRGGRVVVGIHEAGTREPVEVDACAVLLPALEVARRALPAMFEGASGEGDVQLALGTNGRPVIRIRWIGRLAPTTFGRLERAVHAGPLAGALVSMDGANRPARIGDPTPWTTGADGLPLRLAPGGFGQANEMANAALVRHVGECVAPIRADKAVELYAGSGNLSVVLARRVGSLVCVEADHDACEATRANLSVRGLEARVVEADADAYAWIAATKLLVLDPPRTGARAVAERLAVSRVAHVVYVSCDAQTLGRDLAILENVYSARSIAAFEMFPQTSHVEAVVVLERRMR